MKTDSDILIPNRQMNYTKNPFVCQWGQLLSQFDWDLFITLTFRNPVGVWGADKCFWNLIKTIRKDIGHRVEFVRITEWHKFRAVPHYHILMLNAKKVRRLKYVDWWWARYGMARIVAYQKELGARFYLGKYLMKADSSDILISKRLQRYQTPEGLTGSQASC